MNSHKATIPDAILDQEEELQRARRASRVDAFYRIYDALDGSELEESIAEALVDAAGRMGLNVSTNAGAGKEIEPAPARVRCKRAAVRDKRIRYDAAGLPKLEIGKPYAVDKVVEGAMKVFARDERVVSIDSDLASTSGLQSGVAFVDKARALNVGVAEANMMLIGEAFAILGHNTWISTFCPFYDWKVLRRIAVGHQERLEVIEADGWLSEGHGIDLTMLATAADLETQSNGATHMGNDDALLMNEAGHVSIINVSCPRQLLSVMKWVMEGNRGILYIRVLRAPAPVLYDDGYEFEFGRAYTVRSPDSPRATIITSGRCVFEAVAAADQLAANDIALEVLDMPSIDSDAILAAYDSGRPVFIAEQNNGYIWANFRRILFEARDSIETGRLHPINTTGGRAPHYIHSGTYAELAAHYDLDAKHLAQRIEETLASVS